MANDDSWMEKTKGGKRESAYSAPPKREPIRKQKHGSVYEVIREKNQRTREESEKG